MTRVLVWMQRFCDGTLNAPTVAQPVLDEIVSTAEPAGPFACRKALAVEGQEFFDGYVAKGRFFGLSHRESFTYYRWPNSDTTASLGQRFSRADADIASHVVSLLLRCGPTHISRRVVTIWVDAVQAMGRGWFATDMGKKCREVIAPFIGHLDAARAVDVIPVVVRIVASILCASPREIFGRLFVVLGFPVRRKGRADKLGHKAPATLGSSTSDATNVDDSAIAAIASKSSLCVASTLFSECFKRPSVKSRADSRQVNSLCAFVEFYQIRGAL